MEKAYYLTYLSDLQKDFSGFSRFYIGDSYCDKNFLKELENGEMIEFLKNSDKEITLVTPMSSELLFGDITEKIEYFISEFGSEIVVNDYGILEYLKRKDYNKIIWGNMLAGQDKDPSLKFFGNREVHARLSTDNDFYAKYFAKSQINSIELFATHQGIKLSHLNDIKVNLSFPYTVFSVTRYCPAKLIRDESGVQKIPENCEGCKIVHSEIGTADISKFDKKGVSGNGNTCYYFKNRQLYKNGSLPEGIGINRLIDNSDFMPVLVD